MPSLFTSAQRAAGDGSGPLNGVVTVSGSPALQAASASVAGLAYFGGEMVAGGFLSAAGWRS